VTATTGTRLIVLATVTAVVFSWIRASARRMLRMPDFCREEITIAQRFAFQAASAPRDSKGRVQTGVII
jgi:hypothetical protein